MFGTTHGHAVRGNRTRTYNSWLMMRRRCGDRSLAIFARYGGSGITVCSRWANSFEAFLADMGERPAGMTLDRIDNDGHYEPSNCRWATYQQQNRNTSRRRMVNIAGRLVCLMEASEILGINYSTLNSRLRAGMNIQDALTQPLRNAGRGG